MKNGIVVVGDVFVDIKGFPYEKYILAGRNAGDVKIVHGGVGRNIAEDIANMELRPTFVSTVDLSAQGEDVIKKLQRHKVNTEFIAPVENGMGMWLAVFDETGDVVASISKRPDMEPLARIVETRGEEIFSECDAVVVEIDLGKEIIKSVLRFAHKYGKKVYAAVANISIASERRDLIKETDCFVCNLAEAESFFFESFGDLSPEELSVKLLRKVQEAGLAQMVVTLGNSGCVYANANGDNGYSPALPIRPVDTTGAGDGFCAGLAAGLTYGCPLSKAVEIGTRIAASVIAGTENVCPRFLPEELGIDISGGTSDFYGSEIKK